MTGPSPTSDSLAEIRRELVAGFTELPANGDVMVWQRQLADAIIDAETDSGRDTEWRQISAFCRVVSEQAVLGSETAVIHVFIEALAIWDDLDVRAYAAALNHTFSQCVTLNGANPALAPAVIWLEQNWNIRMGNAICG